MYKKLEKDFLNNQNNDKNQTNYEILLSDIQNKICMPGKIFNLDTISLMDILSDLENRDLIKVVRTAGLDVVQLSEKKDFSSCVSDYYAELKK